MLTEQQRHVRVRPLTVFRAERAAGVVVPANALVWAMY
jgi:hypothetical protein